MKFYRKIEGAVLGGVCLGISNELGIDPMLVRLIAIIALIVSGGFIGLIYLILWAVLPAEDSNTNIKDEILEKVNKFSFIKDKIKNPNIIGIVLVAFGILLLMDFIIPMDLIIKILFPIALVAGGIYLLYVNNKK